MYRILTFAAFVGCIIWLAIEPGPEPVVVMVTSFAAFFRDDIHGVIGFNFLSLNPKSSLLRDLKDVKYSFCNNEYINPGILEDLNGWISDNGDQLVAINVMASNESNRYFGEVSSQEIKGAYPIVKLRRDENRYSYQYIGCSFSGVHIVRTWSNGGGSGIFCSVILVTLSKDVAIEFDNGKPIKNSRLLIKRIGSIPIGDRYEGHLKYKFGILTIPTCSGRKSLIKKKSRFIIL